LCVGVPQPQGDRAAWCGWDVCESVGLIGLEPINHQSRNAGMPLQRVSWWVAVGTDRPLRAA
jgi:hypothetical protein